MRITPVLSLACLFIALSTCSSAPRETAEPDAIQTILAQAPELEPTEYGAFTENQLYTAIISELGAQRGELVESGEDYFDLAQETRDLQIIERAVQFASVNGDTNALMQLGLLWSDVDPANPDPHLLLSFQFLESGNFDLALVQMGRVIEKGGEFDFTALASRTGRMPASARSGLIQNLRLLVEQYPQQTSIRTSLVQLLAQNTEFTQALLELDTLEKSTPKTPVLILLRAQIQQSMQNTIGSLKTLRSGVRQFSKDQSLRMSYARLLIQSEDFTEAQKQFAVLIEQNPEDWETIYSIALLDLELEDYAPAKLKFTRLIEADQRADESRYYLAYIDEQQGNIAAAINNYREVRIGTNNFLAARQQATRLAIQSGQLSEAHDLLMQESRGQPRLEIVFSTIESSVLIQEGHPDKARSLLDTALNKFPNDTDLLFARVLLFDSLQDRASSEADLQQIIRMQPDDSRALNHLGYMLADQTERHQEALELIERAIAISPDDPAIIDSLAWAQYKLGRYDDALQNLRRAFADFPDHEVAAHLGEVLWMMDRQDEARRVWQDALIDRPDSELIRAVKEKFGVK
jgi:tetratricopeptide (TPR) repeat protein